MRDLTEDPRWCYVDPITLTGLALGGLAAGTAATAFSGSGAPPAPVAPPPQAAPQKTPQPKPQQSNTTFVGGVPAPPQSTGQKTLLGQ